jgi:MFS-type transporter involved in bile tolerance (Atg22 family)
MGEVSQSDRTGIATLFAKASRFLDRDLNLGALVMILIIVNGSFALFFGMLRNRIYDDYIGLIVALVLLTNAATILVWFMRAPRVGSSAVRTAAGEVAAVPREKGRRERRKKHRRGH